jgi:type IV pilus assembly protein PilB
MTAGIRDLVQRRENADRIKEEALKNGMRTLRDSARLRVQAGVTTVGEMVSVTMSDA